MAANGSVRASAAARGGPDERGDLRRRLLRVLVVRTMTSMWEGQEAQRRQFVAERVPVLHREGDVVVTSEVEDREARCLHGIKDGSCGEDRIARLGAEVGTCKLDRHSGTAAFATLRNSLQRALGCGAARL